MREPLIEAENSKPSFALNLVYGVFVLFIVIFVSIQKPTEYVSTEKLVGPSNFVLPLVVGSTLACGMVLNGQSSCKLSCPETHTLSCSWTGCASLDTCSSITIQMQDRKCEASVSEKKCCLCRLRGGFSIPHSTIPRGRTNVKMNDMAMGQVSDWNYPFRMPPSFELGNDPEWFLQGDFPPISIDDFDYYVKLYDELLNQDYMKASYNVNPYDPSSWTKLGTSIENVVQWKILSHQVLQEWFDRHPTRVYSIGKRKSMMKYIPTLREGIVIISEGKASSIRNILETSWWGTQWKELVETGPEYIPPILILFVHQDEYEDYRKQLLNFPYQLFIVAHAASGSGVIRNKALGILKKKIFRSGLIIDDDVHFMDSSGIFRNRGLRGLVGKEQPAQNMLEVMFDILSGDIQRAKKWKGETNGVYHNLDFIAPFDHVKEEQIGKMSRMKGDLSELRSNTHWDLYRGCIGLSSLAIQSASYKNTFLYGNSEWMFAKEILKNPRSVEVVKSPGGIRKIKPVESGGKGYEFSLLEVQIGRKDGEPPNIGPLQKEFWNFYISRIASYAASLKVLDFSGPGGAANMADFQDTLAQPEITYAALSIYQWCKLHFNPEDDTTPEFLFLTYEVFNGLYNERKPVSWAQTYLYYNAAFADTLKEHPFSDTMPAKLMSLYLEGNAHFLEEEAFAGYSLPLEKEIFEVGSGPYFNDRYTIVLDS